MPKKNGYLTLSNKVQHMSHEEVLAYTPHYIDAEFVLSHKLADCCLDCPRVQRGSVMDDSSYCPADFDYTSPQCLHYIEVIILLRDMIEADLLLRYKDGDTI